MTNIIDMARWQGTALSDNAKDWLLVLFVRGAKRVADIYRPINGCAELQRRGLAEVIDGWVFLTAAGNRVALADGMGDDKAAIAKQDRTNEAGSVGIRHALAFMLDTLGGSTKVPEDYPFGMVSWKRGADGTTTFRIDDAQDHGSAA